MKPMRLWGGLLVCVILWVATGCYSGHNQPARLYQVSTIGALQEGVYEGAITCGELKKHGNFGLGTFDKLDGEMVVLDGAVYQCRADSSVRVAPDDQTTPFACVTIFRKDRVGPQGKGDFNLDHIKNDLDSFRKSSPNLFYAVRIPGFFSYVKIRSVSAQKPPYPRLAEAVNNQKMMELHNVRGTLIGMYCPPYIGGLNVPGWHFHFLTKDLTAGGHVLDATVDMVSVYTNSELMEIHEWDVVLPENKAFLQANLQSVKPKELEKAEK